MDMLIWSRKAARATLAVALVRLYGLAHLISAFPVPDFRWNPVFSQFLSCVIQCSRRRWSFIVQCACSLRSRYVYVQWLKSFHFGVTVEFVPSAIKLEKVPESAVILEKVLFSDLYKIVSLCSIFLLHQSKLS